MQNPFSNKPGRNARRAKRRAHKALGPDWLALADRLDDEVCPTPVIYVMNRAEDGYCMSFSAREGLNPERAYADWIAQQNPDWIAANGYHPVRELVLTREEELMHEAALALRQAAAAISAKKRRP